MTSPSFVIDASVAVEYLLKTPLGLKLAPKLFESYLYAPSLIDVEVLSALRRAYLRKHLSESNARQTLEQLSTWPIERLPALRLLDSAWKYRDQISAYDALYVAAAKLYKIPLLTSDSPLAKASVTGVKIYDVSQTLG